MDLRIQFGLILITTSFKWSLAVDNPETCALRLNPDGIYMHKGKCYFVLKSKEIKLIRDTVLRDLGSDAKTNEVALNRAHALKICQASRNLNVKAVISRSYVWDEYDRFAMLKDLLITLGSPQDESSYQFAMWTMWDKTESFLDIDKATVARLKHTAERTADSVHLNLGGDCGYIIKDIATPKQTGLYTVDCAKPYKNPTGGVAKNIICQFTQPKKCELYKQHICGVYPPGSRPEENCKEIYNITIQKEAHRTQAPCPRSRIVPDPKGVCSLGDQYVVTYCGRHCMWGPWSRQPTNCKPCAKFMRTRVIKASALFSKRCDDVTAYDRKGVCKPCGGEVLEEEEDGANCAHASSVWAIIVSLVLAKIVALNF